MIGRYGQDELNRVLSITGLIALIVSIVIVRLAAFELHIMDNRRSAYRYVLLPYVLKGHCQTLGRESEIS